jgi:hypothetical protein
MTNSAEHRLRDVEISFIADFLDCAASDFSDRSCNDFSVPGSAASLKVLLPVVAHRIRESGAEWDATKDPESWLENGKSAGGEYVVPDEWIAAFLSAKYKSAPPGAISAAEALIVADLLDEVAELHEEWAEQEADTDPFTLPPGDEYKAFMAAKKIMETAAPMNVPDHWAMRYLAHRCRSLAADAETVPIESSGRPSQATSADGIPAIDRPGIAPRFPDVKKYLKSYTGNFGNWEDKDLRFLAQYAAEGPGFDYRGFEIEGSEAYVYRNYDPLENLERCSLMLRWHAIQVALGAAVPKPLRSKGAEACLKQFEVLRKRAPHLWSYSDAPEKRDFKVAAHLLYDQGFTQSDVEQAILAYTPVKEIATEELPVTEERPVYAARIAQEAASDPAVVCYTRMRQQAEQGLEAYRKQIGADWTIPWRRSLAYHYAACQMGKHLPQGFQQGFDHLAATMVHCLLLGWEDQAWDLHQRCHDRLADEAFCSWSKKKPDVERRTQLFVLRLLDQWQDRKREAYPPQAHDEPVFEALLAHWRHPDPDAIAPLLLAACDRHTCLSVAKGYDVDLERPAYWYDPFEILLVLHLRRRLGLANPVLDHPIMNTPLGSLPEPAAEYREALLDDVMARFRMEFPAV